MWPKTIYVKGIGLPVESWEEIDEIVERYGSEHVSTSEGDMRAIENRQNKPSTSRLAHKDQVLLRQFIERGNQGVLNSNIGPLLFAKRKGIAPALREWSRRIGLAESTQEAFEPFSSAIGRGYKLLEAFVPVARALSGT